MNFIDLGLNEAILQALQISGYTEPTPIQAQAIPTVLEGRDLLAAAQTGTGKTAGFTLPILHRLAAQLTEKDWELAQADAKQSARRGRRPGNAGRMNRSTRVRALILTPTRELAAQVHESVLKYGANLPLRSAAIFGGVSFGPQRERLRQGQDILVATPGRLMDHVQQGNLDLSTVEILVLDEADRMLDMGFIRDIRYLLSLMKPQRQNLLFSATFTPDIRSLAHDLLRDPVTIDVAPQNATADRVAQNVIRVDTPRKRELLTHLIQTEQWFQVLVFMRTKHGADRLAEQLTRFGIQSEAIHGNKTQSARMRALQDFKQNRIQVLVATDIAARGIDIADLPFVINYELPQVAEDYVHRIGRTGRAGATGQAISLVSGEEYHLLQGIERLIRRRLPSDVVAGFEPDPSLAPAPRPGRGGRRPGPVAPRSHHGAPRRAAGESFEPRAPRPDRPSSPARRFEGSERSGPAGMAPNARPPRRRPAVAQANNGPHAGGPRHAGPAGGRRESPFGDSDMGRMRHDGPGPSERPRRPRHTAFYD